MNKKQNNKVNVIKIKIKSKDIIKKVTQFIEWEQISTYHISDKGLVSRIYKDLLHSKKKKTTQ